jgi:hypothetical protein
MKTIIKLVVRVLIIAVVVAALYAVNLFLKPVSKMKASLAQSSIAAPINVDGEVFRDLNRNGSLDPYEDLPRRNDRSGGGSPEPNDPRRESRSNVSPARAD